MSSEFSPLPGWTMRDNRAIREPQPGRPRYPTYSEDINQLEAEIGAINSEILTLPRGWQTITDFGSDSASTGATPIWVATLVVTTPLDKGTRRIRWAAQGHTATSVAGDIALVGFDTNNGTWVDRVSVYMPFANSGVHFAVFHEESIPANTARTRRLGIVRAAGTGNVRIGALADLRTKFWADDVGQG